MDISTTYMGLKLKNPIIISSSRLTGSIDNIKKCAEHGAGAIVLKSLFEEQLLVDPERLMDQDKKYFWFPEAVEFINGHSREQGMNEYLEFIQAAKTETELPIIASINCNTPDEWPKFASKLEEAGADGIELNISIMPFDSEASSQDIEDIYIEIVKEVKKFVKVPVAVKISPMFTNILGLVKRLEGAGADAVVLFNRFYRPDIDVENEKVVRKSVLSGPEEVTQPLRWISILSGSVSCDIAGNTGIHTADGVIKHLMVGADAIQICSVLYKNGIDYIGTMLDELEKWFQKKNYSTLSQIKGKLGRDGKNAAAFERVQYMKKTLTDQ
ncbi:MAG: dihydroorotate dehydrogenase-like protein [Anaerolineales bacterium]|nr:dihydroorotate dehydrogenase-like protein [Anaerolineales bacterium]